MNNTMEYKGYVGSVEFSEEDNLFYGKVMGIRALISYEGTTAHELVYNFRGTVEDYLALCKAAPQKPV
jgi:predicted HicB family RNase H-like nuclease